MRKIIWREIRLVNAACRMASSEPIPEFALNVIVNFIYAANKSPRAKFDTGYCNYRFELYLFVLLNRVSFSPMQFQ